MIHEIESGSRALSTANLDELDRAPVMLRQPA